MRAGVLLVITGLLAGSALAAAEGDPRAAWRDKTRILMSMSKRHVPTVKFGKIKVVHVSKRRVKMLENAEVSKDEVKAIPNPGSEAAVDAGCTCPVMDNAHGEGAWGSSGEDAVFWVVEGCTLHATPTTSKSVMKRLAIQGRDE